MAGATLYTTLEPCTKRSPTKVPCATRLADAQVSTVVIGSYDPNPIVHQFGWKILRDAGIRVRDFPPALRAEVLALNAPFIESFQTGRGDTGTARFDYMQNGGRFEITDTRFGTFETRWTAAGGSSIYALDYDHNVALQRFAGAFSEIDDASAYPFDSYTVSVSEGQIAIFRNGTGWLLVKVEDVKNGDRGDGLWEVTISWEARGAIPVDGGARVGS